MLVVSLYLYAPYTLFSSLTPAHSRSAPRAPKPRCARFFSSLLTRSSSQDPFVALCRRPTLPSESLPLSQPQLLIDGLSLALEYILRSIVILEYLSIVSCNVSISTRSSYTTAIRLKHPAFLFSAFTIIIPHATRTRAILLPTSKCHGQPAQSWERLRAPIRASSSPKSCLLNAVLGFRTDDQSSCHYGKAGLAEI